MTNFYDGLCRSVMFLLCCSADSKLTNPIFQQKSRTTQAVRSSKERISLMQPLQQVSNASSGRPYRPLIRFPEANMFPASTKVESLKPATCGCVVR